MDYTRCDYDTTTVETLIWTWQVPNNVDSTGNLDVSLWSTIAGTNGYCWDLTFRDLVDSDVVDGTFSTALASSCSADATVTGDIDEVTMTFTAAQHSIEAGDYIFIKLQRDVADGNDDNTADLGFLLMELEFN